MHRYAPHATLPYQVFAGRPRAPAPAPVASACRPRDGWIRGGPEREELNDVLLKSASFQITDQHIAAFAERSLHCKQGLSTGHSVCSMTQHCELVTVKPLCIDPSEDEC